MADIAPRLPVGNCWGTNPNASFIEFVDTAARHGFGTLAITPPAYRRWREGGGSEQELRRRLEADRMRVVVIDPLMSGLPGSPRPDDVPVRFREGFLHDEAYCYEVARGTGAGIVNIAHFLGKTVPLQELADAIGGVGERAGRLGLKVSLEFIPDTGMPDLLAAEKLRQLVKLPNVGIMLDTWHLLRSGGTVEQIKALERGAIIAAQLSDRTPPPPDASYTPMAGRSFPGEGAAPLADIVNAVLDNNPDITIEVEVFNEELRALSADAATARTADAVRSWLQKGGKTIRWRGTN
jgi:sugar phosphate isomerase/epimerase